MQFTSTIFSLLVASAAALPAAVNGSTTTLEVCNEANYGCCQNITAPVSVCNDLPADLKDNVSSVKPEPGFECLLMQGHCNANAPYVGEIYSPGIPDLSTLSFDNKGESFICLAMTPTKRLGVSRLVSTKGHQIGRLIIPGQN